MSHFIQHLLRFFIHLGYFGPVLMGFLDSSFLFLPFGNDLLVIALVARNHHGYLLYVLMAACGSTLGVFFLDLIARKVGEGGVTKVAGQKQFDYLKRKIGQHGSKAILLGSLAPPPFPFTMVVAINSALGYPRKKLLALIAVSRAIRFLILGALAIKFGRVMVRIANTAAFKDSMYVFTAICLVGSAYSIFKWVRKSRRRGGASPGLPQAAKA